MIQPQQLPTNWTAIGVFVAICVGILGVIGWFVVHSLAKRRDGAAHRRMIKQAVSDFDIVISRWIDAIIDKHERLPTGWGMRLNGPFDMRAGALGDIRAESLSEIEAVMRRVRPNLSDAAKGRFDEEWRKYQDFQIVGVEVKNQQTGQEFTTHTECKKGLMDCLEQMRKIAHE
jgi:hypothetical protein